MGLLSRGEGLTELRVGVGGFVDNRGGLVELLITEWLVELLCGRGC